MVCRTGGISVIITSKTTKYGTTSKSTIKCIAGKNYASWHSG